MNKDGTIFVRLKKSQIDEKRLQSEKNSKALTNSAMFFFKKLKIIQTFFIILFGIGFPFVLGHLENPR